MSGSAARACRIKCRVGALALLVTMFSWQPVQAATPKVWTWTTRALHLLVRGEHGRAVVALARARKAQSLPELDALVGIIGLAGGEVTAGRQQLEGAIQRGSTEPLVFYWAGRAAMRAGDHRAALKRLRHALAIGGDRPLLRMGQALALTLVGRIELAARSLAAVARVTPNLLDPRLYPTPTRGAIAMLGVVARRFPYPVQLSRTQGYLSWQSGDVLSAAGHFRAVLAKQPRDGDAMRMLARCEQAVGRTDEALALINRAIDADPDALDGYGIRGMLLKQSDPAAAARDLRRSAAGSPRDATLLVAVGQACAAAQHPKCAHKFFQYAVRRDPRSAAARFGLALQLQQAGKLEEAERSFSFALGIDRGNPRYYEGAANFYQIKGDRKRAHLLLAEARRVKPLYLRFRRLRQRAIDAAHNSWAALARCGCSKTGCKPKDRKTCQQAVGRVAAGPAREFFRSHLAMTRSGKAHKAKAFQEIVSLPRVRRLLLTDPSILKLKGKLKNGLRYALRAHLPMVPPWLFR